jgi:uncharacterized protein YggE
MRSHKELVQRIVLSSLVVFLASPVFAQQQPPPTINVSGSAEIKVVPDEIHLRVGVETRHEVLAEAKKQNDERIARALAFLKTNGVMSKNVQTDFISIEPSYDNLVSRTKPTTYIVRKSIEVKSTDIAGFERMLTGLLNSGITDVHNIEFRTSQLRKHRDAARAMAIRAAREKADALAHELGVKLGKVYNISANDWGGWWSPATSFWGRYGSQMFQNVSQNAGGSPETDDSTLSAGQIGVSASVTVSFLIQ